MSMSNIHHPHGSRRFFVSDYLSSMERTKMELRSNRDLCHLSPGVKGLNMSRQQPVLVELPTVEEKFTQHSARISTRSKQRGDNLLSSALSRRIDKQDG